MSKQRNGLKITTTKRGGYFGYKITAPPSKRDLKFAQEVGVMPPKPITLESASPKWLTARDALEIADREADSLAEIHQLD